MKIIKHNQLQVQAWKYKYIIHVSHIAIKVLFFEGRHSWFFKQNIFIDIIPKFWNNIIVAVLSLNHKTFTEACIKLLTFWQVWTPPTYDVVLPLSSTSLIVSLSISKNSFYLTISFLLFLLTHLLFIYFTNINEETAIKHYNYA